MTMGSNSGLATGWFAACGWGRTLRRAGAVLAVLGATISVPSWAQSSEAKAASAAKQTAGETQDILIFRNGRTAEGRIVSENATSVRFAGTFNGIPFETDYPKTDILEIKRGVAKAAASAAPASAPVRGTDPVKPAAEPVADGATRVYVIELTGKFGEEITQTPIRNAIEDAKRQKADVLVFKIDNEWKDNSGLKDLPDDASNFSELFRAEEITPIFASEIRNSWDKPPRVVFWVKTAMAGACFLPFVCPEMYFHSEGRMGGLGNLQFMYGTTGDPTVRNKLMSALLSHAEGWANAGGYDFRIVRAMAIFDYVLSYRMEGGKAVLVDRAPGDADVDLVLLTDDGAENSTPPRRDTAADRVAGRGNDFLTLNANIARDLGVSKGTADTLDDLFAEMGLGRNFTRVDKRSEQVTEGWKSGLRNAKRSIKRLAEEFSEIQIQGNYEERVAARGARIRKIDQIKALIKQWKEALTPRWFQEAGIPDEATLNTTQEQLRVENLRDKRP